MNNARSQRPGALLSLITRCVLMAMLLPALTGCRQAESLVKDLMPAQSSVIIVLDESLSCWEQVRVTGSMLGAIYLHPRACGPKSPVTLLVGGQGSEWLVDTYGNDRKAVRERLTTECASAGYTGELGTDICGMLDRVSGFVAQAQDQAVTVVIVSDFVADPARDSQTGEVRPYRDPAGFSWQLTHPEKLHLRLYMADDAQMVRLTEAWQEQLTGADVKWFRPNHIPQEGDL